VSEQYKKDETRVFVYRLSFIEIENVHEFFNCQKYKCLKLLSLNSHRYNVRM